MILSLAMILDAIFGEPKWLWSRLPHPAVLMGRLIAWGDEHFNNGEHKRIKGALMMIAFCCAMGILGLLLGTLGWPIQVIITAILLAQRSLVDHVLAVAKGLRTGLEEGRAEVAMIVGRETGQMDENAVGRAAIESAAENLSDGIIAPAFWFAVAGLPGLLIYKITNTADSMIGYRTPRYEAFGWAAARLDDVLNFIPARLTALLIAPMQITKIGPDARLHRSPNAGWPEAAMALRLDIALSGPRTYEGQLTDFPWVNAAARKVAAPRDIEQTVAVLWSAWAAALALSLLLWLGMS
jgi:adenosylcobinamide-phosphate synthase